MEATVTALPGSVLEPVRSSVSDEIATRLLRVELAFGDRLTLGNKVERNFDHCLTRPDPGGEKPFDISLDSDSPVVRITGIEFLCILTADQPGHRPMICTASGVIPATALATR